MQTTVRDLLKMAGVEEKFYPGKRIIQQKRQPGQFKSYCVVFDWRDPDLIRVEIKAGLSGKDLPKEELRNYPISLQSPTWFEFEVQGRA